MDVMPTWTSQELDRIGAAHEMRIASVRSDGTFVDVDGEINDELDAAYRQKYGNSIGADHIVMQEARAATLKIIPR
jgi:hypothetical protein